MKIKLYNEDCKDTMKRIPNGSIDLMVTDIPYGTTACEWDVMPNLDDMWLEWERILKPNGLWVFTASQPTTSKIINSRIGFFKVEWIWSKTIAANFGTQKYHPAKHHENIIVMGRGKTTYNPQLLKGKAYKDKPRSRKNRINEKSLNVKSAINNPGVRNPSSIVHFPNGNNGNIHPTQKPVDLFRYLIKTYSNEGDTVYDGYSGSGTTAIACIKENRNFIGAEMDKKYFTKSMLRINQAQKQLPLF